MAVPVEINNLMLGSVSKYQISRSVRLRSSASAFFNRTPSIPTNNKIWTWSAWVKKGLLTSDMYLFSANGPTAYEYIKISGASGNSLEYAYWNGSSFVYRIQSTLQLRDTSAWYHISVSIDTTQATASNRVLLYVNGIQVTSFTISSYPPLNTNTQINLSGLASRIGSGASTAYFDGYLTEINFIDGQALTPSSFGEYDIITGVWKPKKYAGTYGTNGFYLNFSDNSAATAAAIGKDYSGNGNNWTPNNISLTAGATYDSMVDVPTPYADGSTGRGNYATLNPLYTVGATSVLSNGNLQATTGTTGVRTKPSTIAVTSGKWYWEVTPTAASSGPDYTIGIGKTGYTADTGNVGYAATEYSYYQTGVKINNNVSTAYGATYTTNDVIGIALDLDVGTLVFYKNNVSQGTAFSGLSGEFVALASDGSTAQTSTFVFNFGQRPFTYTPPTGFLALNTQNLPTPTIASGNDYFDVNIWSGNASTQIITNSGAMQPDFVWIKKRAGGTVAARDHRLFDAVRGATKYLSSNLTSAEATETDGLTSFNSDGFTLGASDAVNGTTGGTGTYVGWQWNAGGSTVTNTSGTISSQVRANPAAGFSVVTYTGTSASTATIGHGLNVAPNMIIVKNRSQVVLWPVYHASLGNAIKMKLNLTDASAASGVWNSTTPTSTVFSIATGGSEALSNGDNYVAYCFAEVAGYSKFGSYTGNGSADGPFVFTGFRPRFVLVKAITAASAENWSILDTARSPVNVMDDVLWPNVSTAEQTNAINNCDFTSNGFKFRTTDPRWNSGSYTYIYMAFAENPFKYSLAR